MLKFPPKEAEGCADWGGGGGGGRAGLSWQIGRVRECSRTTGKGIGDPKAKVVEGLLLSIARQLDSLRSRVSNLEVFSDNQ